MTALFFGDSHSQLFGFVHEPAVDAERGHGVLIFPPVAQEHVRSHWALRQVAATLARAGYHVLRFDWFGVGDSAGELAEATLARWSQDAETAAQELKDATGVRRFSIVGLRLGATLACLAQKQLRARDLVLWDPVLSGQSYVDTLRAIHLRASGDPRRFFTRESPRSARASELVGFDFGAPLLRELSEIEPEMLVDLGKARVTLLCSQAGGQAQTRWQEAMEKAGRTATLRPLELAAQWDDMSQLENQLLPADALRAVADTLEGS